MTRESLDAQRRQEIDELGYTVLEGILTDVECDQWSEATDAIWERERGKPHAYEEETGVRFVDNLLRFSALFEKSASEASVVAAVRSVLGPGVILNLVNARRSDPGYGLQPLHDLDRPRGHPFHMCNTIWCLDEFTPENGSTRVIPGSHLDGEPFLSRITDPRAPHPDEITISAPRGAVVIFNAHMLHAGGRNETDRPRRSVQSQFTLEMRKPFYPWHELPAAIVREFQPETLRLLALA